MSEGRGSALTFQVLKVIFMLKFTVHHLFCSLRYIFSILLEVVFMLNLYSMLLLVLIETSISIHFSHYKLYCYINSKESFNIV